MRTALILLLVLLLVVRALRPRHGRNLHLVRDASGNECLLVRASLAGRSTVFLVDTAYAGAPVLSLTFLARQARGECSTRDLASCMRRLRRGASADDAREGYEVLRALLLRECRSFTSGCTMRLMGIGETKEAQSDMLLCPGLRLEGVASPSSVDADDFVTNPLRGNPHILTSDYLLHRAPALLRMGAQTLELQVSAARQLALGPTFDFQPARFAGGAFVVKMLVGDGELDVVVDTGAAAPLSVSKAAASKIKRRTRPDPPRRITQVGVNGERVCSDVHRARVRVGKTLDLGEVDVLFNSHPVEGADAYAGMGLLRAVDVWLEPRRIGFRRSGLPTTPCGGTAVGTCA